MSDDTRNKEQVYDEDIFPLMDQIIEVCKRHHIAMLAQFEIPTPADAGLRCLTALCEKDADPSRDLLAAKDMLRHGFVAYAVRTRP